MHVARHCFRKIEEAEPLSSPWLIPGDKGDYAASRETYRVSFSCSYTRHPSVASADRGAGERRQVFPPLLGGAKITRIEEEETERILRAPHGRSEEGRPIVVCLGEYFNWTWGPRRVIYRLTMLAGLAINYVVLRYFI